MNIENKFDNMNSQLNDTSVSNDSLVNESDCNEEISQDNIVLVLVVDDEADVERLITQKFRRQIKRKEIGFVFACNGIDALKKMKEQGPFDVMLTDINMPEMDGLSLLSKVVTIDETMRSVVVSAYGDLNNIRTAMNRGAFDFLTKPLDFSDLEKTLNKTVAFVKNLREQKQELRYIQDKLKFDFLHDELTSLPNKNCLSEILKNNFEKSKKPGSNFKYTLLFIGLSRFKIINDTYGHAVGDEVLKLTASKFNEVLDIQGELFRFSGDEFVIVLSEVISDEEQNKLCRKLLEKIIKPFHVQGFELYLYASIGIASSQNSYAEPNEILRDADAAFLQAKKDISKSYINFDKENQNFIKKRFELEASLHQALKGNELDVFYQPLIDAKSSDVVGFEALVRWKTDDGFISPEIFIPIAEEIGLIKKLGYFVFEKSCNDLIALKKLTNNDNLIMNINVSTYQLLDSNFVDSVSTLLKQLDLPANNIKFEITEGCLLDETGISLIQLNKIKDLGIKICVDDFGTGYSSLARLHEFPVSTLKIDRSFINNMDLSKSGMEMVKMIIGLAETLGMSVVAEGIENKSQKITLKDLGCDILQGFYCSKPLSFNDVSKFLIEYDVNHKNK